MSKLTTVGFEPPPDFPTEGYNKVHLRLNKYKDTHNVQWGLFGLGWNGLAYRYRAMAEYDEEFTNSVKISGNSPPPDERYKQGKAFFGFFTNAVSVIECFVFSIYCIASILKPSVFPVSQSSDLEFTPREFTKTFDANFQNDSLSATMQQCLNDSTYWKMKDIRRVLIHRGMPPRKFYRGGERDGMATMPTNLPAPSDQWRFDFSVDENTTAMFRKWLGDTLKGLIDSANDFCVSKL